MKKLIPSIGVVVLLVACNNSGTTTKASDSTNNAPGLTNVQNVNGNQPDTTSGIKLDTRQNSTPMVNQDSMQH